jgi:hypothetical protein
MTISTKLDEQVKYIIDDLLTFCKVKIGVKRSKGVKERARAITRWQRPPGWH